MITTSVISKPLAETFLLMLIDVLKLCAISRKYLRRGFFSITTPFFRADET